MSTYQPFHRHIQIGDIVEVKNLKELGVVQKELDPTKFEIKLESGYSVHATAMAIKRISDKELAKLMNG